MSPLDPRIEAALRLLPPRPEVLGTPAQRRAEMAARAVEIAVAVPTQAQLAEVRDAVVSTATGGVPVRIYRPVEGLLPAYVFLHGGGWWLGSLDESDAMCRRRAADLGCVVVSVDYRLAPEHPFPAPLDDSWAAAQWVFDSATELGIDATRIAIGGGSAGGNLAAAVTLLARDERPLPFVAQVLEVPATDLTLTTSQGSADECAEGYGLTKADLHECAGFYVGDHDPKDPLVSPLLAELHDLPPAYITVAEYDPVRDDGIAYAAKLVEAGVPTLLRQFDGQVHGSYEMDVVVPEVAAAFRAELKAFLGKAFQTA